MNPVRELQVALDCLQRLPGWVCCYQQYWGAAFLFSYFVSSATFALLPLKVFVATNCYAAHQSILLRSPHLPAKIASFYPNTPNGVIYVLCCCSRVML